MFATCSEVSAKDARDKMGVFGSEKNAISSPVAPRTVSRWDGSGVWPSLLKASVDVKKVCLDDGDKAAPITVGEMSARRVSLCRCLSQPGAWSVGAEVPCAGPLSDTDTEVRAWPAARRGSVTYTNR